VLSVLAVLCCLALAALLWRNWRADIRHIVFGNQMFQVAVLGAAGATMLLAMFGTVLGFNSAGQRRNDKQRLSWVGFFLGAGTFTMAVILFAAFFVLRVRQIAPE
jgi:hypothetical protein